MAQAIDGKPYRPSAPPSLGTAGKVLALLLICELFPLCAYFIMMSFFMLTNMGFHETWRYIGLGSHMLAAVLYFFAILGLSMCLDGRRWLFTPVKWLLITLAVLGMSVSSIGLYEAPVETGTSMIGLLWFFGGLSLLLLVNTVLAFQFMDTRVSVARD
jgi:hypothetical protein